MENDKVSVIIPVYNAEKFLNRCLDSVINQSYKNLEIICVNDGSKDSSLKILKDYQKRDDRIIIIDKENAGVSSARNDGIRKSTGEYISFVDADDWVEIDMIESLYNSIIENGVDVVRGNYFFNTNYDGYDYVGNLGDLAGKKLLTNQSNFVELFINKLLNGSILSHVVLLLIKRECVMKTSLFNDKLVLMEDTLFYNELMNHIDSIYFFDKPIYHFFQNPNSCTKSEEYYIRNIYNLIKGNNYLTELIRQDKFEERDRIEIINTYVANTIAGYIYAIYLSSKTTKKDLVKIIDKMLNEKEIYELLYSVNFKLLPIHLSIPIKLIRKKKYNLLFAFYNFRTNLRKK